MKAVFRWVIVILTGATITVGGFTLFGVCLGASVGEALIFSLTLVSLISAVVGVFSGLAWLIAWAQDV